MINYVISVLLHVGIIAGKTLLCKTYCVTGNLNMGKKYTHKILSALVTKKNISKYKKTSQNMDRYFTEFYA